MNLNQVVNLIEFIEGTFPHLCRCLQDKEISSCRLRLCSSDTCDTCPMRKKNGSNREAEPDCVHMNLPSGHNADSDGMQDECGFRGHFERLCLSVHISMCHGAGCHVWPQADETLRIGSDVGMQRPFPGGMCRVCILVSPWKPTA